MGGEGGGGLFGGIQRTIFGDGGAGAAEDAAMAQQAQAQRNYGTIKSITDMATTQGIAQFEKDLQNQERELGRQEQLVSQIDPTIMEASQQALKLLRGESSSTLAPIKAQRDQQRAQLLNRLREQMGPGAETSTAGIQALTRFDSETNSLLSGQQQSALQLLGGTAGQFSALRPNINQTIGARSQYGQGGSGLQFQQADMLNRASGQLTDTAGAQYTGDVLRGKQDAAFGQQMIGAGMAYATGGMSAAGGAAKPATGGTKSAAGTYYAS